MVRRDQGLRLRAVERRRQGRLRPYLDPRPFRRQSSRRRPAGDDAGRRHGQGPRGAVDHAATDRARKMRAASRFDLRRRAPAGNDDLGLGCARRDGSEALSFARRLRPRTLGSTAEGGKTKGAVDVRRPHARAKRLEFRRLFSRARCVKTTRRRAFDRLRFVEACSSGPRRIDDAGSSSRASSTSWPPCARPRTGCPWDLEQDFRQHRALYDRGGL